MFERTVRKRHQEISGEVGNLERTKDGTNKMKDKSNWPKSCQGNPISPRVAQLKRCEWVGGVGCCNGQLTSRHGSDEACGSVAR